MKRDEFKSVIKEVYTELLNEFPTLKFDVYRDGGSVSISNQNDEIIMVAPVQYIHDKERICMWFNHIEILKEGCKDFNDSYKEENIVGRMLFDNLPTESPINREKIKKDIIMLIKSTRLCSQL
jgi:hypothetical protein